MPSSKVQCESEESPKGGGGGARGAGGRHALFGCVWLASVGVFVERCPVGWLLLAVDAASRRAAFRI